MKKLKNWGFYVIFVVGAILDLGFNEIQPALEMVGMEEKYMGIVRILILVLGALKLKLSLPTQNVEKLKDTAEEKESSKNAE